MLKEAQLLAILALAGALPLYGGTHSLLRESFDPSSPSPGQGAIIDRQGGLLSADPDRGEQVVTFPLKAGQTSDGNRIYTLEAELEDLKSGGWISFGFNDVNSPGGGGPEVRVSGSIAMLYADSGQSQRIGENRGGYQENTRLRLRINPVAGRISGHIGERPFLTADFTPRPDQTFESLSVQFQKSGARVRSLAVEAEEVAPALADAMRTGSMKNVLMISVDDLRPELSAYGVEGIHSPNIDRLAKQGTVFQQPYCQVAVCHPSRASLLTGMRPETLGVTDWSGLRTQASGVVTVMQHFIDYGYQTQRIGKIFHIGHGNFDDIPSWTRVQKFPEAPRWGPEAEAELKIRVAEWERAGKPGFRPRGPAYGAPEVPDEALRDGKNLETALGLLEDLKDQPFFLAVGFSNPHLPFVAPKRYWDLYPEDSIHLPEHRQPAEGAPPFAHLNWGELRMYHKVPQEGPMSEPEALKLIHGYRATVSYIDHLIGRLLDKLDSLGLRDDTVIVLWGDHGYHLLDHGVWCKHTNYDIAVRTPLIIAAPEHANAGVGSGRIVELLDVAPTLVDYTGLPLFKSAQGRSLRPIIEQPDSVWDDVAFHAYPRQVSGIGLVMGRGIRTPDWHFIEWRGPEGVVATELYDMRKDPAQTLNVASQPEHQEVIARLGLRLQERLDADLAERARLFPAVMEPIRQ